MTRILYLTHDLDDSATWRRVSMLEAGGAVVEVAGFRRGTAPLSREATVLGQTYSGRFLHRALSALRLMLRAGSVARRGAPDVIVARNLEMLPLAHRIRKRVSRQRPPRLFYEALDIHRLLVGPGMIASLMRLVERRLCRNVDRVLISSMRFDEEHFRRYRQIEAPPVLIENKVWDPAAADLALLPVRPPRQGGGPIVIGWFGILRCAESLRCLDALCRDANGRVRLVLRGRPALDVLPDFHQILRDNPHIEFHGAYRYPDDLPEIYGGIDIAWLVDRFEAGANSEWLLPNRLYESCANGAIPLALEGTETGRYLSRRGLGLVLPALGPEAVAAVLESVDENRLVAIRARIAELDMAEWRTTRQDCIRLVDLLAGRTGTEREAAPVPQLDPVEIVG
ncbi:glycosyl transferase [Tabrizicola sp.]|uniref:glycosyl transferase n=1 Tax=Tabrizicola sp. TaxID=2005166 RepID=UPI0026186A96|nr:glycosyl transferase [Tabrizicola sp.]MDM7932744.1 glycosyl transferase [Tabrizicola sp.]